MQGRGVHGRLPAQTVTQAVVRMAPGGLSLTSCYYQSDTGAPLAFRGPELDAGGALADSLEGAVIDVLLCGITVQVPMAAAAKSANVVRTQPFVEDLIGVVRRSICFAFSISMRCVATNKPAKHDLVPRSRENIMEMFDLSAMSPAIRRNSAKGRLATSRRALSRRFGGLLFGGGPSIPPRSDICLRQSVAWLQGD